MSAILQKLFFSLLSFLHQALGLPLWQPQSLWQPLATPRRCKAAPSSCARPPARRSVVPAAIARHRAQHAASAQRADATAAARPFWISVDPADPRRTVMSGTPREVCRVLDVLLAMEHQQTQPLVGHAPAAT